MGLTGDPALMGEVGGIVIGGTILLIGLIFGIGYVIYYLITLPNKIGKQNIQDAIFWWATKEWTSWNYKTRWKASIRIIAPILISLAIVEFYSKMNKKDEKEDPLLKSQWWAIANQFVWNAFKSVIDYPAGILSNASNLPFDWIKEVINAIDLLRKSVDKKEWAKLWLDKILDFLTRKVQIAQTINKWTKIITWDTLNDIVSRKLWVPNLENQTARLNAKWFKLDDWWEAVLELMWVRLDQATQDFLYKTIAEEAIKNKSDNVVWQILLNWSADNISKIQRGWTDLWINPSSWSKIWDYTDQILEENYVWATVRNIDWNKTLWDFLQKIWVDDSARSNIIDLQKKNLSWIRTTNKAVEDAIWTFFFPYRIEWETFSDQLRNLEKINPKWFNNFIAWVSRIKKFIDENPDTNIKSDWFKDKVSAFFNSTTNTDAAIADFSRWNPLTTALTENLARSLFEFKDTLSKNEWIEKTKLELYKVQKVYDIIMSNSRYTNWIIDAASLKSIELKSILEWMKNLWYNNFSKDYPILNDVILRWLELRWEAISKEWKNPTIESNIEHGSTNNMPTLEDLYTNQKQDLWVSILSKKKQKTPKIEDLIKIQKLQPQKQLIWQTQAPSYTSLSEIVKRTSSQ